MSTRIVLAKKTHPPFKKLTSKAFSITVFILLISMVISVFAISLDGLTDELHPADVAVVMGTTANPDGTPSRWLQTRLDKAIEVYNAGMVKWIIVSGGIENNGIYEGTVMANYLVVNGIPSTKVIVDNRGADTFSTAKNVTEIMKDHGWASVTVVSQFYHIPRVKLALHRFGIQEVYGAHAEWITGMAIVWLGREIIAYPVYFFRNY